MMGPTDAQTAHRAPMMRSARAVGADLRALDEVELVRHAVRAPGVLEPDAVGVLYERHARRIFAFAISRLHDPVQAEDVTAQTFLHVLRALPHYQPRGVPIRHWFLKIAANVIRDMQRNGDTLRWPSGVPGPGDRGGGEDAAIAGPRDAGAEAAISACEDAEAVTRLLEMLPIAQRDVLCLRFIGDLSIAETARRMVRSEGAIKALQNRALKTLRESMGEAGHAQTAVMNR